jgi:hypothetical protein
MPKDSWASEKKAPPEEGSSRLPPYPFMRGQESQFRRSGLAALNIVVKLHNKGLQSGWPRHALSDLRNALSQMESALGWQDE